jgi:hypothetical protein
MSRSPPRFVFGSNLDLVSALFGAP